MRRRGFLALIGSAPISVPVAAKEAATKMGLRSLVGGAGIEVLAGSSGSIGAPTSDTEAETNWIKEQIADLLTGERRRQMRSSSRHEARLLDPDLAALRSVSPSFAYTRQLDRVVDDRHASETSYLRKRARAMGIPL